MARFTDLKVSELDNGAVLISIIDSKKPQDMKMIALADWTKFVEWLVNELTPPATEEQVVIPINRSTPDNVF